MNTYFRSIYYGFSLCLIFIGLFGLAIDDGQWRLSVSLIIVGAFTATITYITREIE